MKQETDKNPSGEMVTAQQLARRYNVCLRTLLSWKKRNLLPFVRISARCIRYPVAECDEAIRERFMVRAKKKAKKSP